MLTEMNGDFLLLLIHNKFSWKANKENIQALAHLEHQGCCNMEHIFSQNYMCIH